MARKKIEPIVSLGDESKLTVQKSLPLFFPLAVGANATRV